MNERGAVPLNELPDFQLPKPDVKRSSEDDFMSDLVEATNIVRKYLLLVGHIVPTKSMVKIERGVLIGHMVRVYKLYDTYLHLIVEKRTEIAFIILRALIETVINFRFLIRFGNEEIILAYQKASLAYEKKLWDEIQSRKRDPMLPIEERMLSGIEETFSRAEVAMDSVSFQDRNWGGDLFSKSQQTELVHLYEFGFRSSSNFVHGTWHELEFHHLRESDGEFQPAPNYSSPGPQMIEAVTISCLEVVDEYLQHIVSEGAVEISERLQVMIEWFKAMINEHEKFLEQIK